MQDNNGGTAFPFTEKTGDGSRWHSHEGMSLRDYFAGQALANPSICDGKAPEWQLRKWFGEHATNITREQIISKQAHAVADAMLKARKEIPDDK